MDKKSLPTVEQALPHESPMILLDRLVQKTETGLISEVIIREGIPFFDDGVVSAFVGVEYMAQTVAAFSGVESIGNGGQAEIGFLLGIKGFTSKCRLFSNGQILQVAVNHDWGDKQLMHFIGVITDSETKEVLQEAQLSAFKPENSREFIDQFSNK